MVAAAAPSGFDGAARPVAKHLKSRRNPAAFWRLADLQPGRENSIGLLDIAGSLC
jgi:hypothetical protein